MNGGIDMPKRKNQLKYSKSKMIIYHGVQQTTKAPGEKKGRNESVKENAGHTENEGDCSQGFSGSILVFRFSSTRRSLIL
jgi:hypothetical protein